ncbi:MAG: hypothetical protein ACFBSD_16800 [Paracoccaceae bacterium]
MLRMVLPALLALGVLINYPAEGQAQALRGCWNYSDANVFSSACFESAEGGTFTIEYAAEDPVQGLVKGSCIGTLDLMTNEPQRVVFSVPLQEDACRQEDQIFRMFQRDYDCIRQGAILVCSLVVLNEDGSIFNQAAGLRYAR